MEWTLIDVVHKTKRKEMYKNQLKAYNSANIFGSVVAAKSVILIESVNFVGRDVLTCWDANDQNKKSGDDRCICRPDRQQEPCLN